MERERERERERKAKGRENCPMRKHRPCGPVFG
jgi:hypothetical protein